MADEQLAHLLTTQKSLTEWLEDIKHKDVEILRREDNQKRDRLRVLNEIINLPYDRPVQFEASELTDKNSRFQEYLQEHGEELCALRLLPKEEKLPKLRMRGKKVVDAYLWFKEQKIDASKYRADFIPHPPDYSWSTIFIVNQHGVQGEIVNGGHHLLTQGFHDQQPIIFHYDFSSWRLSFDDEEALTHLKKLASLLLVKSPKLQHEIEQQLSGEFISNYLTGYFETTDSSVGTWFIDYNQTLGKMYSDLVVDTTHKLPSTSKTVTGRIGNRGTARGPVRIVAANDIELDFPAGSILVCEVTTPNHVPLMQRAAAIVTDRGGILSHAAIVARELEKPCIVATGNVTTVFNDGDIVTVDANTGTVTLIS